MKATYGRSDKSGNSPTILGEDGSSEKHHNKGDRTGNGREVTHECRVVVGVGECLL